MTSFPVGPKVINTTGPNGGLSFSGQKPKKSCHQTGGPGFSDTMAGRGKVQRTPTKGRQRTRSQGEALATLGRDDGESEAQGQGEVDQDGGAQLPTSGSEGQPQRGEPLSSDDDEPTASPALGLPGSQLIQQQLALHRPPKEEQRAVAAFKVPPFESDRADKFFFLCEDRFIAVGIYDHNLRASCVMEYLPNNLVEMLTQRFAEFNISPDRYLAIKQAVLEYCKRPFWARMQTIHQLPHVGTISPTQLMCRIIALKAPDEPVYEMLKYEFLRRLPTPLFEKFKARKWGDAMAFAVRVEAEWSRSTEARGSGTDGSMGRSDNPTASNSSTSNPQPVNLLAASQTVEASASDSSQDLAASLQPLVAVLQRVVSRGQPANRRGTSSRRGPWRGGDQGFLQRGRGRGSGPPYPRPWQEYSADQRSNQQDWCFYHQRFGANAWACRQPCSYNRRTATNSNNSA